MAILSLSSPAAPASTAPQQHLDTLPAPPPPGPTSILQDTRAATLKIPLDDVAAKPPAAASTTRRSISAAKRESAKRDSPSSRREELLRGKEGSRRRQRWENDRLLSNPHAMAPTAADWEPRPLHPQKKIPYEFAFLWDHPAMQERAAKKAKTNDADKVPKDLKIRLKKAHGAIGLLKSLEEELRSFLLGGDKNEEEQQQHVGGDVVMVENELSDGEVNLDDPDSEDEIVFVSKRAKQIKNSKKEKVLFESLLNDPGASFGRWLVHSIAAYYGLRSWSVTTGKPAKRLAYVGVRPQKKKKLSSSLTINKHIPRPLWMML